jgi:hypothetical protein
LSSQPAPALGEASGTAPAAPPGPASRLTATQIQGAAYRMMRAAVGRPINAGSTLERMQRLNAGLSRAREALNDEPGNVAVVLDSSHGEAFYKLRLARYLAQQVEVEIEGDERLGMAIADAAASCLAGGGACGELTAHTTTATALEGDERLEHLFDAGRRQGSDGPAVPSHHFALLRAGARPDPALDLVGDGLSRHSAMLVEDTDVDLSAATPQYRLRPTQLGRVREKLRDTIEDLRARHPSVDPLLGRMRQAGLPRGRAPFSERTSIIRAEFADRAREAIEAMSETRRNDQAIYWAMQEVPGLTAAEAASYKDSIIAAAVAGK